MRWLSATWRRFGVLRINRFYRASHHVAKGAPGAGGLPRARFVETNGFVRSRLTGQARLVGFLRAGGHDETGSSVSRSASQLNPLTLEGDVEDDELGRHARHAHNGVPVSDTIHLESLKDESFA